MRQYLKLILVTQRGSTSLSDYLQFVRRCASSGVTAVQLREKGASAAALIHFGKCLKKVLRPLNVPLFVNDSIQVARAICADGVHLGQTDGKPVAWGKDKMLGLSIEHLSEVDDANRIEELSYVAASAVFPTQNKRDTKTLWGIEGVEQVAQRSKHPVIGIGGINVSNVSAVLSAGACGVAVIGALHDAKDPEKACRELRQFIDSYEEV